jgi:hypothetical protein
MSSLTTNTDVFKYWTNLDNDHYYMVLGIHKYNSFSMTSSYVHYVRLKASLVKERKGPEKKV